ncbi:MAG: hypothetical protein J6581_06130 [Apibacter sp.]|nr:hypothetical protein [Apibacter sp.]
MDKEKKFSFLAGEYDTGALLNSKAPIIGDLQSWGQATPEQVEKAEAVKKEEIANKLRAENEKLLKEGLPEEKREMVIHGATLHCPYAQA